MPRIDVVHLEDDLDTEAPPLVGYVPGEVPILRRKLRDGAKSQDGGPVAEASIVIRLVANQIETQDAGVEIYRGVHVLDKELEM
jgi:hypothetical protein